MSMQLNLSTLLPNVYFISKYSLNVSWFVKFVQSRSARINISTRRASFLAFSLSSVYELSYILYTSNFKMSYIYIFDIFNILFNINLNVNVYKNEM